MGQDFQPTRTVAIPVPPALTDKSLGEAANQLAQSDPRLAAVLEQHGVPPMWSRDPGFATLVHVILEQQVSLASAQAAFDRLEAAIGKGAKGEVLPSTFLALDDGELKAIGFSRQKAGYARHLALAIDEKSFELALLAEMPDQEVRAELLKLKGIGNWTADIYLIMVLRRPDVWPHGDIALATSLAETHQLAARPSFEELDQFAERWRPWRAVAARFLWLAYLAKRGKI